MSVGTEVGEDTHTHTQQDDSLPNKEEVPGSDWAQLQTDIGEVEESRAVEKGVQPTGKVVHRPTQLGCSPQKRSQKVRSRERSLFQLFTYCLRTVTKQAFQIAQNIQEFLQARPFNSIFYQWSIGCPYPSQIEARRLKREKKKQ